VFLVMTAGIAYANRWFISYLTSTSPHSITYQVTGQGDAEVTYAAADGGHTISTTLPWEITITVPDGTPLSVAAAGQGTGGSATCRIKWEGHTITVETGFGSGSCSAASTA
jgi:MmpS family membrane protein